MNPDNASESLTRPELASQLSDADWVALHVPRYAHAAPAYAEYESFLKTVLKELTAKVAPLAIVETRAKRMASFAEKILRKRQAYQDPRDPLPPDPLIRLTDLCGGRVVCQTAEQVRAVCQLIENAFVVDWANSEDVSQRLKPAEFGYRSVHYIVQPEPERLRNTGVNTPVPRILLGFAPEELGAHAAAIPLKCEIQVRTLLEHASSDLGHDTIYKTELKIPDRIKRQYAALAAVLEGADREIERLLMTLAEFRSNYGAWHERGQVEKEIAHARVLLGLPDDRLATSHKVSIALRAARLALSIGRHELAVTILEPHTGQHHPGLHRVLGQALVELHWHEPHHPVFERGRHHLEQATESSLTDAETLSLRAECAAHLDDDVEARRLFALAVEADGAEPLTLARYLEFETAHSGNDNPLRLASPMIRAGIVRAQRQIEARANLASAWSAIAVFHLFLGEPFPALDALAQVIRLCEKSTQDAVAKSAHPCAAGRALLRLRDTVRRLRCLRERLEGFDWFERLVLLALATKMGDQRARAELLGLATWAADPAEKHFSADQRTVFFAGGCSTEVEPSMASFRPQLQRACSGLEFVLVSGGTGAGISGVAGDIAASSGGRIQAVGYLPKYLPANLQEDAVRFPRCIRSSGKGFSPLDPLQAWTDLICADVSPAGVKVICYAPGLIARAECAIALALGARVGCVVDGNLPKTRQFDSNQWEGCRGLLLLPKDAMTIRAFLEIDPRPLTSEAKIRLEPAAKLAHEDFVKSAIPKDASLQAWEKLSETLKFSNYAQVAYWQEVLRDYGLGVRPLTDVDRSHDPLTLEVSLHATGDGDQILTLAELEHGRWNVERLSLGWKFAAEKDVGKKLSPWLIPWAALPKDIQQYDIDAIKRMPQKLRRAGLELYMLRK